MCSAPSHRWTVVPMYRDGQKPSSALRGVVDSCFSGRKRCWWMIGAGCRLSRGRARGGSGGHQEWVPFLLALHVICAPPLTWSIPPRTLWPRHSGQLRVGMEHYANCLRGGSGAEGGAITWNRYARCVGRRRFVGNGHDPTLRWTPMDCGVFYLRGGGDGGEQDGNEAKPGAESIT